MSFEEAYGDAEAKALGESKQEHANLPSLTEATGAWREPLSASAHGDVHFSFSTPGLDAFTIRLPAVLRRTELRSLSNPDQLGWYALDYRAARDPGDVEPTLRDGLPGVGGRAYDAFLSARREVFADIEGQHERRALEAASSNAGVVEVADLLGLEAPILRYATAFQVLVEQTLSEPGRNRDLVLLLAQLDALEVRWRRANAAGDSGRALLLGPTHPLRLLWHLRHAQVTAGVLRDWAGGRKTAEPSLRVLYQEVRDRIRPQNLPMVVFDGRGRAFTEQELLTPHWSLYLPTDSESEQLDLAACRDTAQRTLGLRGIGHRSSVTSAELAARLVDYVELHPYVEQLRINLFHPGDGQLLADTLRRVELLRRELPIRQGDPPELRYAVSMFTAPGRVAESGEAVEELLDPERQVGEDDEFTHASGDHLRPKLVFSRNRVSEFLRAPGDYRAHVSILLEQFRVEARLRDLRALGRCSFVGGLIHEARTLCELPGEGLAWVRGVHAQGGSEDLPVGQALVRLLATYQQLQSTQAAGAGHAETTTPALALTLSPQDQALIRQVHDASDWVLTIDRNLGLDFFDRPSATREAGYLLDYTPEYVQEERQRLLLTTRSTEELQALVRSALEPAITVPAGGAAAVLECLRSLSGRLALRLLAGAGRHAEILGLLMARWMLERAGLLVNHILIPVDAHGAWFASKHDETSQRRADLLLVGIEAESRTVEVSVVEVKLRRDLEPGSRSTLYASMAEQASNTRERLRARFDPGYFSKPRADLLLRAKELAGLLGFYLGRSCRYGLMSSEAAAELSTFIEDLDRGYRLRFRLAGVVFVQSDQGFRVDDLEPDLPVYRFGSDFAQGLLDDAAAARRVSGVPEDEGDGNVGEDPGFPGDSSSEPSMESLRSVLGARLPGSRSRAPASDPEEDGGSGTRDEPPSEEYGSEDAAPPQVHEQPCPDRETAPAGRPEAGPQSRQRPVDDVGSGAPQVGIRFPVGTTSKEILPRPLLFHPSNTALSHLNTGVVGDMGTGKTQLIKYLVARLYLAAPENRGRAPRFLVFDYKEDYSRPDFVQSVDAKLVRPEQIPLNVLRLPPRPDGAAAARSDWVRRGNFLYDTLHKIYGGVGPVQKKRLRNAVVGAFEAASEQGHDAPLLSDVLELYEAEGKPDSVESILSDLVDLDVFAEDRGSIQSFDEFLHGVVVVQLADLGADQLLKNTVVAFLLNLFYDWMLRVEKQPFVGAAPQLRFIEAVLLIDEADNIMQYDFAVLQQILQQGREFGVGVLLASQYLSHFRRTHFDYREPLLTWFIHRVPNVGPKDIEGLGLTEVGADVVTMVKELGNHEFLCKTLGANGRFGHGNTFWRFREDAWIAQHAKDYEQLLQRATELGEHPGRLLASAMDETPPDLRAFALACDVEAAEEDVLA